MMTTRDRLRRPGAVKAHKGRLWNRDRQGPPRRRRTPELLTLERRELLTIVPKQSTIFVSPNILPPTGQVLPVTFSGVVASTLPQTPIGFFHVTDEYRQYEPHGSVTLTPLGPSFGYYKFAFRFVVDFPTNRSTNTADGRHYYVLLGAQDANDTNGETVAVLVPKTYPPPTYGQTVVAGPKAATTRRAG